ncbi:MAG: alternative ribosome rescue aminoacyl-tRNA hydrolase ArfB [Bowdeniella nasicola]|nr:alternative ribosome rescue aminoacyl-tRNA hydrolase ArfB [Bowdeniella nasicola]
MGTAPGAGLRLMPGPGNPTGLTIAEAELVERFSRAAGPGGQGVNTTDSRVQLSFDVRTSASLSSAQRARILRNLAHRLDDNGVFTVSAATERSQLRNRAAARERMAEVLRTALMPPPPKRRATRPTRGSVERRLAAKRRRAMIKRHRARPRREE